MFKRFLKISSFTTLLAGFPNFAFAQSPATFADFIVSIVDIINSIIPFIIGLTFFVIIFGIFRYISVGSANEEVVKKTKDLVLYGILAIFVMLSVWGIVSVLKTSFFPEDQLFDAGPPYENSPSYQYSESSV